MNHNKGSMTKKQQQHQKYDSLIYLIQEFDWIRDLFVKKAIKQWPNYVLCVLTITLMQTTWNHPG